MKQILFISTGDTCRSPMCMSIFNAKSSDIIAKSAGIFTQNGVRICAYAILGAKKYDVDISDYTSCVVTSELLEQSDKVYCMTASHSDHLKILFPDFTDKIDTIAYYDIDDPFGGTPEIYEQCADKIHEAICTLHEKLGCM